MKKSAIVFILCMILLMPDFAMAARYASVKLVVEEYALEGGKIEAGSEAVLTLRVRNTNNYVSAGNIVFTLEDAQGRIIPQGPSGIYVNEIARGGTAEIRFRLKAMPDAQPGYAQLTLNAEYETAEGQNTNMSADVYLEISQEMRLEHGVAGLVSKVTEGDNIAFSMDFLNMGKGVVYNVLMAFDIPGLNGGSAVLVGNIEPGESKTGRANLLVSKVNGEYGNTSGTLTLTWENAAGEQYEEVLELSTTIAPKPVISTTDVEEQKEESKIPAWLPGALIAAAGVGLVVWIQISIERRRRRERDEKML